MNSTNYELSQNLPYRCGLLATSSTSLAAVTVAVLDLKRLVRHKLIDKAIKIMAGMLLVNVVLANGKMAIELALHFVLAMTDNFAILQVTDIPKCQIYSGLSAFPILVLLVMPVLLAYGQWKRVRRMDVTDHTAFATRASIAALCNAALLTVLLALVKIDATTLPICDVALAGNNTVGMASSLFNLIINTTAVVLVWSAANLSEKHLHNYQARLSDLTVQERVLINRNRRFFKGLFPGMIAQCASFLLVLVAYMITITTGEPSDQVSRCVFNLYLTSTFCAGSLAICLSIRRMFQAETAAVEPDVNEGEQAYRFSKLNEQWNVAAKKRDVGAATANA